MQVLELGNETDTLRARVAELEEKVAGMSRELETAREKEKEHALEELHALRDANARLSRRVQELSADAESGRGEASLRLHRALGVATELQDQLEEEPGQTWPRSMCCTPLCLLQNIRGTWSALCFFLVQGARAFCRSWLNTWWNCLQRVGVVPIRVGVAPIRVGMALMMSVMVSGREREGYRAEEAVCHQSTFSRVFRPSHRSLVC